VEPGDPEPTSVDLSHPTGTISHQHGSTPPNQDRLIRTKDRG